MTTRAQAYRGRLELLEYGKRISTYQHKNLDLMNFEGMREALSEDEDRIRRRLRNDPRALQILCSDDKGYPDRVQIRLLAYVGFSCICCSNKYIQLHEAAELCADGISMTHIMTTRKAAYQLAVNGSLHYENHGLVGGWLCLTWKSVKFITGDGTPSVFTSKQVREMRTRGLRGLF